MKMKNIHPYIDEYRFDNCDEIIDFAVENNISVKGHTLVWHLMNPKWIAKGEYTKSEIESIMTGHITAVVSRYKDSVDMWDVVNEPIKGDKLRETIWYDAMGEEYIAKALLLTHSLDSDAKLFINDYGVCEINKKSTALYNLICNLIENDVPIDGVGFQMHIDAKNPPDFESVEENIKRFAELGIEIALSEVDVRLPIVSTQKQRDKQAQIYQQIAVIAAEYPCVTCFTMWGVTDKYSWIRRRFICSGHALIYDRKYVKKPAYYALAEGLR